MTGIVDDNETSTAPPASGPGEYDAPIFGDSPEGTHIWQRVPYDADHYGRTFAATATALGLGPFQTVAFADSEVERFLGVDPDEEFAVYLLSAGIPERPGPLAPAGFAFPALPEAAPARWPAPAPWPAAG